MKVKKLGISWGAAYVEAQPFMVTDDEGNEYFTCYVNERQECCIVLPAGPVVLSPAADKLTLTIQ